MPDRQLRPAGGSGFFELGGIELVTATHHPAKQPGGRQPRTRAAALRSGTSKEDAQVSCRRSHWWGSTGRRRSSSESNRPTEEADHHMTPEAEIKLRYRVCFHSRPDTDKASAAAARTAANGSSTRPSPSSEPLRGAGEAASAAPRGCTRGARSPVFEWIRHG